MLTWFVVGLFITCVILAAEIYYLHNQIAELWRAAAEFAKTQEQFNIFMLKMMTKEGAENAKERDE